MIASDVAAAVARVERQVELLWQEVARLDARERAVEAARDLCGGSSDAGDDVRRLAELGTELAPVWTVSGRRLN